MRDGRGGDRGRLDRAARPATRCSRCSSPGWRRSCGRCCSRVIRALGEWPRSSPRSRPAARAARTAGRRPRAARLRREASALRLTTSSAGSSRRCTSAAPRSEPRAALRRGAGRPHRASSRTAACARSRSSTSAGSSAPGGEQGLLSVAFHPRYAQNRRFYVNYTDSTGTRGWSSTARTGRAALPGSARQLLFVRQPYIEPQRRPDRVRPRRRALRRHGRRRLRRRSREPRAEPGDAARQADPHRRRPARRAAASSRSACAIPGASASTAHRRPLDRRRRPERVGGGRLPAAPAARASGSTTAGTCTRGARPTSASSSGPARSCSPIGGLRERVGGRMLGDGRLRLPRQRRAGRARALLLRRLLQRDVRSLRVVNGRARGQRRERFRVPGLTSFGEDARGELLLVSHNGTVSRLAR